MGRREVEAAVQDLLGERGGFSSADLSRATGLTRQALHRHLSGWVAAGELVREGRARATRYRRAGPGGTSGGSSGGPSGDPSSGAGRGAGLGRSYPLRGLAVDRPWRDLEAWLDDQVPARSAGAQAQLRSLALELVTNAARHSAGESLTLRAHASAERVALAIQDDGIGALEHLGARLGLAGPAAALRALQERAPGTGEGLAGLARQVSLFELDANGFEWSVDNETRDQALAQVPPGPGTEVRASVDLAAPLASPGASPGASPADTVRVPLATHGQRLVTRSQARAAVDGLGRQRDVLLDFTGVEGVGLGFVDELFRVWPAEHPHVRLRSCGANAAVELMVAGRPARPGPDPAQPSAR